MTQRGASCSERIAHPLRKAGRQRGTGPCWLFPSKTSDCVFSRVVPCLFPPICVRPDRCRPSCRSKEIVRAARLGRDFATGAARRKAPCGIGFFPRAGFGAIETLGRGKGRVRDWTLESPWRQTVPGRVGGGRLSAERLPPSAVLPQTGAQA